MWDNHDRYGMARFLVSSGMEFTSEEARLIAKLQDEDIALVSVYDLHTANILCYQALGWMRAKS